MRLQQLRPGFAVAAAQVVAPAERGKNAFGSERRGTAAERGYGAEWQRLRKRILKRDNWLCRSCREVGIVKSATNVDHITPRAEGGTEDENNLQSLCKDCHDMKTLSESARASKPSALSSGYELAQIAAAASGGIQNCSKTHEDDLIISSSRDE